MYTALSTPICSEQVPQTAELEVAPPSITSLRGAQHTPSYLILASAIEMQGLYHTSGVHGGDSLCEQLSTRAKNNQLKRSTQSDLWHEAYSIKDGCSFVQYVDGPEYHISCLGCGREFAKRYLRQGTLVEIRDVPP
ncbi:hypothetical protein RhiTH_008100 [Rhizoctonia solani]